MAISGAVNREGVAYSPDGAVYVQIASGSTIPSPTFTGTVTHSGSDPIVVPNRGSTGTLNLHRSGGANTGFALDSNDHIWWRQGSSGAKIGFVNGQGIKQNAAGSYAWANSNNDIENQETDTALARNAAGVVEANTGAAGTFGGFKAATYAQAGANGQLLTVKHLTELTTIAAAANTDTTIQMPAGAVILAVSVRVTTAIPTATDFTVGDSGSAARFSTAAVSTAADSTDKGTKAGAYYNASALSVRITPNLSPVNNTGRVRVTIHYYEVTPPTS